MNPESICTSPGVLSAAPWGVVLSQCVLTGFLVVAGIDLMRYATRSIKITLFLLPIAWALLHLSIVSVAAALVCILRDDMVAVSRTLEMFQAEVTVALTVLLFLMAARTGARPSRWSRTLPLLDRLAAGRRAGRLGAGDSRLPRWRAAALAEWTGWLTLMLGFSTAWLWCADRWAGARVDAELVRAVTGDMDAGLFVLAVRRWLPLVLAAFSEEAIYRGYIEPRLARRLVPRLSRMGAAAVSVLLVSIIWALGHGGMIDPVWVKWVQIGGIGLVLGVVRIRLGLEACIALHLIFNVAGVVLV